MSNINSIISIVKKKLTGHCVKQPSNVIHKLEVKKIISFQQLKFNIMSLGKDANNESIDLETLPLKHGQHDNYCELDLQHKQVVEKTKKSLFVLVCIGVLQSLIWSGISNVWLLAGETIKDDVSTLTTVLFASYFAFGIETLILSSISVKFGYDNMMILLFSISPIGYSISAFALTYANSYSLNNISTNNTMFILFCISQFISVVPGFLEIGSLIIWLLPVYNSKQVSATWYQLRMIGKIIAPVFAGVVITITNYQIWFTICALLIIIVSICVWIVCYHLQSRLESEQLKFVSDYANNNMYNTGNINNTNDNDNGESGSGVTTVTSHDQIRNNRASMYVWLVFVFVVFCFLI